MVDLSPLLHADAKPSLCAGANIQIATPVGYEPDADVVEETKRLAKVRLTWECVGVITTDAIQCLERAD